jgi:hypothetical protein
VIDSVAVEKVVVVEQQSVPVRELARPPNRPHTEERHLWPLAAAVGRPWLCPSLLGAAATEQQDKGETKERHG